MSMQTMPISWSKYSRNCWTKFWGYVKISIWVLIPCYATWGKFSFISLLTSYTNFRRLVILIIDQHWPGDSFGFDFSACQPNQSSLANKTSIQSSLLAYGAPPWGAFDYKLNKQLSRMEQSFWSLLLYWIFPALSGGWCRAPSWL